MTKWSWTGTSNRAKARLAIYKRLRLACEQYQKTQRDSVVEHHTFHILAAVNTILDSLHHKEEKDMELLKAIERARKRKKK